jgi:hypothetical protein
MLNGQSKSIPLMLIICASLLQSGCPFLRASIRETVKAGVTVTANVLEKILLDWDSIKSKRKKTPSEELDVPEENSTPGCRAEILASKPFKVAPDATERFYFQGFKSSPPELSDTLAADTLFEAYFHLPSDAILATQKDIEAMLEKEKMDDILDCQSDDCMGGIGDSIGAAFIISAHINQLADQRLLSARLISSAKSQAIAKTVIEYTNDTCLKRAVYLAATSLLHIE